MSDKEKNAISNAIYATRRFVGKATWDEMSNGEKDEWKAKRDARKGMLLWEAMTDKEKDDFDVDLVYKNIIRKWLNRTANLNNGGLVIGNLNNGGHVHLEGTNTIDNLRNCGTLTLQQGEDGGVTTIHQYEKEHNCKVTNDEKAE